MGGAQRQQMESKIPNVGKILNYRDYVLWYKYSSLFAINGVLWSMSQISFKSSWNITRFKAIVSVD